ncbi:MAG: aminomethyl-transferring glycine dehydrogenase subunit GcvPA [Clostridia bacterium]|nr:aminomethyl-transferring glycine dehydrogenase subunit GcvPA [Clostridia bacterium]
MEKKPFIHPYMPNSAPQVQKAMLDELGVGSLEELYEDVIPKDLRLNRPLDLPQPLLSEQELKKHVEGLMDKNISCDEAISFLGAGCYRHFVPAVCDEINGRSEFLTAYCGDTYSDHGKMQAIFEYCSMMAELLDLDVVSYTNYDGGQAAASSLRMALRITGRTELLLPKTMNPDILSQIKEYCQHVATITFVDYDSSTGLLALDDLKGKLSDRVAAVFWESPSYLGTIETQGEKIAELAHQSGALVVAYADPSALGILESPANLGADIVCGDIQGLGMHQSFGGGCAGYIASDYREEIIAEYPTYMYGITTTHNPGEYGWGRALNERCSHISREKAKEYFGTETGLWAITAAVYLASMGPEGLRELGETIVCRCNYAIKLLSQIKGLKANIFNRPVFCEFIVNFDKIGLTVAEVNAELLKKGIFGGLDLSTNFPELGQSALYCVTETISAEDIEKLAAALTAIAGEGRIK